MVSGLVTSPCDQLRIFSGDARLMRMESKSAIKLALSYGEDRKITSRIPLENLTTVNAETRSSPRPQRSKHEDVLRVSALYQSAASAVSIVTSRGFFINSTSKHNDCNSRISTLNDSGTPGSIAASPFTMAS